MATFYDLPNYVILYLFNNFTDFTTITISRFVNKNLNLILSNEKNKDEFLSDFSSLSTIEWYCQNIKFQPATTLPYIQNDNFNFIIQNVIQKNNLECLKDIYSKYILNDDIIDKSISQNNLECIQFLLDHNYNFSNQSVIIATKKGNLEILKKIINLKFKFNKHTCSEAARFGHLEILKYVLENGCQMNELICINAAFNGHLHILQYAHQNGCYWDEETCYRAAAEGHL